MKIEDIAKNAHLQYWWKWFRSRVLRIKVYHPVRKARLKSEVARKILRDLHDGK